jgi:O-antigen/teichoic acid export membrane protein
MLKRVLTTLAALGLGHFLNLVGQLVLPAAFLAAYGLDQYGAWLILSASVGYLATLDFGLQTYATNELIMLYHRKEMEGFHQVQSVSLRMTGAIVCIGTTMVAGVLLLPTARLLKIELSSTEASWSLFWLASQVLGGILYSNINNLFRVFGQAHRNASWNNLQRVLSLVITMVLVNMKASFAWIAFAQWCSLFCVLGLILMDIRKNAPEVYPSLHYWNGEMAWRIFRHSSFFALFTLNNFLLFQAPLLMLNAIVGSSAVVGFTVGRTLFSFVRQTVTLVQQAMAPEMTRLNGIGDKVTLAQVFTMSESMVLTSSLVFNAGILAAAPLLLQVWIGKPELYEVWTFFLLMVISTLMNLKDYKIYLQYATNNHIKSGIVSTSTYLIMLAVSYPLVTRFGVRGFLWAWLVCELVQIGSVHNYNRQVLGDSTPLTLWPLARLCGVLLSLIPVLALYGHWDVTIRAGEIILRTMAVMLFLGAISYYLFNLSEMFSKWMPRLLKT